MQLIKEELTTKLTLIVIGLTAGSGLLIPATYASFHPVTSSEIADNTIQSVDILDGTIASADIKNLEVKTADIADSAVTTAKIGSGQVGNSDIATSAVTTGKISDTNGVQSVDIVNGQVGSADIADGTITSTDIAPGTIPSGSTPADNSVTSAKIVDDEVQAVDMADATITAQEIAVGTITGGNIKDGTIQQQDIAPGTIPSGGGTPDDNSVTSAKIVDGEIHTADIGILAVGPDNIQGGGVWSYNIKDGEIWGADIDPDFIKFKKLTDSNSGGGWDPNGSTTVFGITDSSANLNSVILINTFKPDGSVHTSSPQPICQVYHIFSGGGFFFRCDQAPQEESRLNYIVFRPLPS